MTQQILKVASCQFPVSCDIDQNADYIKNFITQAADKDSDIVHFSETALSGYAGLDFSSYKNFNWQKLFTQTRQITDLIKKNNIWTILGSSHYIDEKNKPANCLYIISNDGKIVDRYDKSMLAGKPGELDTKHFTAGNHLTTISLKGITCGFAICSDSCYPPIYNAYRHKGVRLMFNSFHNAGTKEKIDNEEYVPAIIRTRAFDYSIWMVANNSSTARQSWPTSIASPRGLIVASLQTNVPGILYYDIPQTTADHNDFACMIPLPKEDIYHRGQTSNHPRIINTTALPWTS